MVRTGIQARLGAFGGWLALAVFGLMALALGAWYADGCATRVERAQHALATQREAARSHLAELDWWKAHRQQVMAVRAHSPLLRPADPLSWREHAQSWATERQLPLPDVALGTSGPVSVAGGAPQTMSATPLSVRLPLRHELDWLAWLDALERGEGALTVLTGCDVVREAPASPDVASSLRADCSWSWLSLASQEGRP